MLKSAAYKTGLAVVGISMLIAGCASSKTHQEARTEVRDAETTLANFLRDPEMTYLQEHMKEAKAVLVSPQILKGGFIVGGSGGTGMVLAHNRQAPQGWTGPAFYKLGTATIGFQAGGESAEMVALVMSDKAFNSLLSSSVKLGGDISVAAGPVGAGAGGNITADMIVFTRTKGLYGGVNLEGTVISIDDTSNKSFYGKPASPVDILVKRTVTSPDSAPLVRVAASAGRTGAAGAPGRER